MHWTNGPPAGLAKGIRAGIKVRYRQDDQRATVRRCGDNVVEIGFDRPQRAVAPGQYAVIYDDQRCLGGGVIDTIVSRPGADRLTAAAAIS